MEKKALKHKVLNGEEPSGLMDSGASSTFVAPHDKKHFQGTGRPSDKRVSMPNGKLEQAGEKLIMKNGLREPANQADSIPTIKRTLVSTSKVADAGYITVFDHDEVNVYEAASTTVQAEHDPVMTGWRDEQSGLWKVPLAAGVQHSDSMRTEIAANVHELPSTERVIRYLHAACGFPTKPTWLKAIQANFYPTWPMLTSQNVNKHFPESEETQKGHMRQIRTGTRKTQRKVRFVMLGKESEIRDIDIQIQELRQKRDDLVIKVYECTNSTYTDQTGEFPIRSSRGAKYIMVLCEIDGNLILAETMTSRRTAQLIKTYNVLLERLRAQGIHPKKQFLDNEAPEELKTYIREEKKLEVQLITPHNHRANIAERAIQTFKNHFCAILAGVDDSFPIHLWDRLLPQAERTLNMLRPSNVSPHISAYMYAYGTHDFNAHPFAPMGCAVQLFETPQQRKSWDPHSVDGWYIGPAMEHYRNHTIWVQSTRSERSSDNVWFKHKYITNPSLSAADHIVNAAKGLTETLKTNKPSQLSQQSNDALAKLAKIFNEAARQYSDREAARDARLPGVNRRTRRTASTAHATPGVANRPAAAPGVAGEPTYRLRNREVRSIHDEAMLSAMEMTTVPLKAKNLAARRFPLQLMCELAGAVLDPKTGELMEYRHLIKKPEYVETWTNANAKEIGRLAQGIPGVVEGTDTFNFIKYEQIPNERKPDVTYARICCNLRPEKEDPYRVRITVGGDRINYPFDVGTPTADMQLVKLLFNSIISTPNAKFMSLDISNFYLKTPMKRPEYMRMHLDTIPQQIIELYNLKEKADAKGFVYVEITKGMYGLPQAGIIAQELLEERLNARGYRQSKFTPGLWMHETRSTKFALVVDDFGIKYESKEDAQHLIDSLTPFYDITVDWEGTRFIGLTLDWDYESKEMHVSMPGYVQKALTRFKHNPPSKPQHQPHPHLPIVYGAKTQTSQPEDTSPRLNKEKTKFVQEVTGVFLFYARAVDSTMLVALSAIAAEQGAPTENTLQKVHQFLDYAATHPEAAVTYKASDMVLAIHSDALYLSEPKARSRAGGHFFMANDDEDPRNNGAVLNISKVIKAVMSSAAEAELGALFYNAKIAVPMRKTLEELGHPQPQTPVQTDNSTAYGVINNKIQPKATKAMDMRFYWLKDRESVNQFKYYWRPGKTNLADYWTKHHPALHHQVMREQILSNKKARGLIAKAMTTAARTQTARAA